MVLAAFIFGGAAPRDSYMAACLLFGCLMRWQFGLQGVGVGEFPIPVQTYRSVAIYLDGISTCRIYW